MSSPVFHFQASHLTAANEAARSTFKYFWRELSWERRRIIPGFDMTLVKISFEERGKVEHMWITDISIPPDGDEHPMCLNMQPGLREHLAAHPETLTAVDDRGFTLLHAEALAGNAASVETLLAHGADANAKTKSGKTPLDLAKRMGWPKIEAAASPCRSRGAFVVDEHRFRRPSGW